MPLLGICEEAGEFVDAHDINDRVEQGDALADLIIFAADYCSGMGWDLQEIWDERGVPHGKQTHGVYLDILHSISKVQHHHLKAAQGIRKTEGHEQSGKMWLGRALYWADVYAQITFKDSLLKIVEETWSRVKQRDWKKDAVSGGEQCVP
jgi:hypothetical protein